MDNSTVFGIVSQVIVALSPVILAALTWLSTELARLINAKVKDANTRNILNRMDDTAFMIIRELEQSVVTNLKDKNEDGKLTPEEIADIQKKAMDKLFTYMGNEINGASKVLGLSNDTALREFIRGRIEAALHAVRSKK